MFYEVKDGHGLPHDPFKAIVAPRPIGWISSIGVDGNINLAPYSFFNAVGANPPIVMFSSETRKDSLANVEETGEFACNFVGEKLMQKMSETSAMVERGINEFEVAGLEAAPCCTIKPPRVAQAYSVLECKVTNIMRQIDIAGSKTDLWTVFGQVTAVHLDEGVMTDGRFDLQKAKPVARCGYRDYVIVKELIELSRPNQS